MRLLRVRKTSPGCSSGSLGLRSLCPGVFAAAAALQKMGEAQLPCGGLGGGELSSDSGPALALEVRLES